jgi:hypothetical protein
LRLDPRAFRVNAGGRIVPAIHIPDPRRTQKVEGNERGLRSAALGQERATKSVRRSLRSTTAGPSMSATFVERARTASAIAEKR